MLNDSTTITGLFVYRIILENVKISVSTKESNEGKEFS